MITYLAGFSRKKDSVFECVARADGGGKRLKTIPLSLRGFPETKARTDAAMAVAKRQPKRAIGRFLKRALITMQYNGSRRYFAQRTEHVAMCWNGLTGSRRVYMQGAKDAGAATLYAELAPFPGRITLDHTGVNAQNSLSRDPAYYLDWAGDAPDRSGANWRDMGANLTARASRRADVGQGDGDALADAGPFLFVPLQVPNDSQITLFGGWTKSVAGMIAALDAAVAHLPDGWHIRVKEHPSAKVSMADALAQTGPRIVLDNQTDTFAQVAASRGVITINSSVGLQAFFYDKPVIVLGQAYFALPGLVDVTADASALDTTFARAETLTFDPALRAAFMNHLDQVYYPTATPGENGALAVDATAIHAKLAAARANKG